MPKSTKNYNFKKPLGNESALISVLNKNFDDIDEALTPSVTDETDPTSASGQGKLAVVLGWFANRLKLITGKSHWYDTPSTSLEEVSKHMGATGSSIHGLATLNTAGFMSASDKARLDQSTANAVIRTIIMRDSSGRAKIATPSNAFDIANKDYVDTTMGKHKGIGGTSEHPIVTTSTAGFMSPADKTKLNNATSADMANRLIMRGADGRAKIASPSDNTDIANKGYVDTYVANYMDKAVSGSIVTGIYVGDGAGTKEISLDFKPRAVFVCPIGATSTYQNSGMAVEEQNAVVSNSYATTYATEYDYHYVTVAITDIGFKVSYCSSSSHARTNQNGNKYVYIAFK